MSFINVTITIVSILFFAVCKLDDILDLIFGPRAWLRNQPNEVEGIELQNLFTRDLRLSRIAQRERPPLPDLIDRRLSISEQKVTEGNRKQASSNPAVPRSDVTENVAFQQTEEDPSYDSTHSSRDTVYSKASTLASRAPMENIGGASMSASNSSPLPYLSASQMTLSESRDDVSSLPVANPRESHSSRPASDNASRPIATDNISQCGYTSETSSDISFLRNDVSIWNYFFK